MDLEKIASVAHEINRAYCEATGDSSQVPWSEAPDWQRTSAINGVRFHLENPDSSPSASHENWLAEKRADGWRWGSQKNVELKTHPCFVPYEELPIVQQVKDHLFIAVVRSLQEEL